MDKIDISGIIAAMGKLMDGFLEINMETGKGISELIEMVINIKYPEIDIDGLQIFKNQLIQDEQIYDKLENERLEEIE